MVEINSVKEVIKDYIIKQLVSMGESAITFWFKDVDFDGDKVWEYFHMNN